MMEICLEQGALVDEVCSEGNTALLFACYRGKWRAMELLLDKGAGVNTKYMVGR